MGAHGRTTHHNGVYSIGSSLCLFSSRREGSLIICYKIELSGYPHHDAFEKRSPTPAGQEGYLAAKQWCLPPLCYLGWVVQSTTQGFTHGFNQSKVGDTEAIFFCQERAELFDILATLAPRILRRCLVAAGLKGDDQAEAEVGGPKPMLKLGAEVRLSVMFTLTVVKSVFSLIIIFNTFDPMQHQVYH